VRSIVKNKVTNQNKGRIIIGVIYVLLAYYFISTVDINNILIFDARIYFDKALNILKNNSFINEQFLYTDSRFIDIGYPLFLASIMSFITSKQLLVFQIANYLLLLISGILIGKSLRIINGKEKISNYLMIFSPVLISFAPKLYSEIYSIFGVSLVVFGLTLSIKHINYKIQWIALIIGSMIIISTKSFFTPYIIILATLLISKYKRASIGLFVGIILSIGCISSSYVGGRSKYNMLIQTAKMNQSYDTILACGIYNLSLPVGERLLPKYVGVCFPNAPSPNMPNYQDNPYLENNKNNDGPILFLFHPIKFILVSITSLFGIIFFEGIYGNVIIKYSPLAQAILWIILKVILSLFIWKKVLINVIYQFRRNIFNSLLLISPLIYFFGTAIFFPIEQRYFYPLIPLMYIYFWLDKKNIISNIND
jgi:hypothetical protein